MFMFDEFPTRNLMIGSLSYLYIYIHYVMYVPSTLYIFLQDTIEYRAIVLIKHLLLIL